MSMSGRRFHSCYIIDVTDEPKYSRIRLTDSTRMSWFVDVNDKDTAESFKSWLSGSFLKGVPNTLTVFEYEDRGDDPDIENYIKKFFVQSGEKQLNG